MKVVAEVDVKHGGYHRPIACCMCRQQGVGWVCGQTVRFLEEERKVARSASDLGIGRRVKMDGGREGGREGRREIGGGGIWVPGYGCSS
jgi:hypothetical protein